MNAKTLVAGLFVVSMMMAPAVAADHADQSDESVGDYYLVVNDDGVEIWEETNGHSGLQIDALDTDGDGTDDISPDTQVL